MRSQILLLANACGRCHRRQSECVMTDTELNDLVRLHARMMLSASARVAIEKMAEEMAHEILNEPGVRQRLRAMALEAIENSWREWNASRETPPSSES